MYNIHFVINQGTTWATTDGDHIIAVWYQGAWHPASWLADGK